MSSAQPAAAATNHDAFAFVQSLARELSGSKLDIPSFPDVAVRVRRVLQDENVSAEQVTRVVGAEPALAARLLQLANSAALNVSGRRVTDLRAAVTRIGFNVIRSAHVAAMSYVVARRLTGVNADSALLAGLLHGIGKLYVMVRAARFPALFADAAAYNEIVRDWHANIARAILENWEMSDEIVAAVHCHEDLEYTHEGPPDLTDVLIVANLLASQQEFPDSIELNLQGVASASLMKLDAETFRRLIEDCGTEIEALRVALGD